MPFFYCNNFSYIVPSVFFKFLQTPFYTKKFQTYIHSIFLIIQTLIYFLKLLVKYQFQDLPNGYFKTSDSDLR